MLHVMSKHDPACRQEHYTHYKENDLTHLALLCKLILKIYRSRYTDVNMSAQRTQALRVVER